MKNKVNPVAIGMFVLGASVLAVAAVMIFGAAKFFANTELCISHFSESVNGLDVGAPLKFKGVKIGKVEHIRIGSKSEDMKDSTVVVIYSIDIDMLKRKIGDNNLRYDEWLRKQIAEGMRAKLNYQSIVTGMLYIEFDYLAKPGDPYKQMYGGTKFMEVPSEKTGLAEIAKALQKTIEDVSKIDFQGLGNNANTLLTKMNSKLDDLDVKTLNSSAVATLNGINELVRDPTLKNALTNFDALILESTSFLRQTQGQIQDVSSSAKKTLSNLDSVLKNVDSIVMPQSPLRFELAMLLRSMNHSMSSISNLTEYLQRNPSSIITGKAKNKFDNKE